MTNLFSKNNKRLKKDVETYVVQCNGDCFANCQSGCTRTCSTSCYLACAISCTSISMI
jgi:ribosomally synthesized peptide (Cys-rich family)